MHIVYAKLIRNKYFRVTSSVKFLIFFHKARRLPASTVLVFGMLCQRGKEVAETGQGQRFFSEFGKCIHDFPT